ncbi:hypothetical protein GCM10007938_38680 [Vibrio zhanjiangensis]|uniref:ABC transporter ATP-binding protein n=1 Tax=Vibrio zhanjiangensis TaxID=1046128 RepID=A0ABQ6F5E1_9VIBR|nr:hypothetical protein GCM10007938_38680 [Vibrio zhanjiangensis]
MDSLSSTLSQVELQLSDNSLYESENKAKLNQVLAAQSQAKTELEEVELEWMTRQEELEQMEQEFNRQ